MSVRVVVAGYGMGKYHCSDISKTPGLELYGVYDVDPAKSKAAESDWGVKTYASYDDVLSDGKVGLVVLVTPHETHAPMAIAALSAGKHVVTEKVMCLNVAEADAMIAAAKKAGKLLSVFQNRRWDSDYVTVKHVVEQGMLGTVFQIASCVDGFGQPGGWRAHKKHGGGMLYDWGAHLTDQMVQLAQSDPDTVYAQIESRVWNVDVDTFAKVMVRFKNGLVGEIEVGCISWIPRPRWLVRGEKGALLLEGWDDQFRLRTQVNGINTEMRFDKLPSSWGEYYRNISAVLNEGAELAVKPEQVRKAIQVIEAAFRSAETGQSVKV